MKKYLLSVTCNFITLILMGQSGNYTAELQRIIPQTPQAAAFNRYGEYPVSPATGIPQIDIPLYELKANDISIPISVSYHASGIKVEDVATPVGLGWTLNFGGVITRSVYGLADKPNYTNNSIKSSDHVADLMTKIQYSCDLHWKPWASYTTLDDTQSDRYIYNFNGKTGVFRYNSMNNEIVTVPYAPLIIETTPDGFKIKDTDGLIYYFEAQESSGPSHSIYVSAWYITKVESQLTGAVVNFKYKSTNSYSEYITSQKISNGISYDYNYRPFVVYIYDFFDTKAEYLREITKYNPIVLDEITWANNKIKLNYLSDRLDKYKDRLDNFSVYNGSATICNIIFNNKSYWGNSSKNYRMRLDDITISGESASISGGKYQFKYNSVSLPDYNNFYNTVTEVRCRDDYWGYFTGRESTNFIPQEYNNIGNYSANRNPEEYYMKACILQEIIYPTGGSTVFEFEANRVPYAYDYRSAESVVGGLRVKSVITKSDGKEIRKSYEYTGYATQMIKSDMFQYVQGKWYSFHFTGAGIITPMYFTEDWNTNISNPLYSITGWSSSPVFYNKITEYLGTVDANSGKKISEYKENINTSLEHSYGSNVKDTDIPRFFSSFYNFDPGLMSPLLESEEIYEKSGTSYILRKSTLNNYTPVDKGKIICGVRLALREEWSHSGENLNTEYKPYQSRNDFFYYNLAYYNLEAYRYFYLLSSTQTVEYTDEGNIATNIGYTYDSQLRLLTPVAQMISNSNGIVITETSRYPFNENIAPYPDMVQNNVIGTAIQQEKSNGKGEYIAIQNIHRREGQKFVLDQVKSGRNGTLEPRIQYHNYDLYGNPAYVSKDGAYKIVYLWSYSGQYPIAEIKNATLTEVTVVLNTVFSVSTADALSAQLTPNEAKLKDGSLQRALPNALVTTYTYKPLVGMLTSTDPAGITTYYDYDTFGRLKRTYIKEGATEKTIQTYDYHYQNQ